MLANLRKTDEFKKKIDFLYEKRIEKLPEDHKKLLKDSKEIENQRYEILQAYEDELKNLELKFDQKIQSVLSTRNEKLNQSNCEVYSEFWLRVLTNHKVVNNMITEKDRESLKYLTDLKYFKLDDGNSFRLTFEFKENPFFKNKQIDKTFYLTKEMLVEKIESTEILWNEKQNLTKKFILKYLKNSKTGDKKTIDIEENINSFYNFFCNLRMPNKNELKDIKMKTEEELGNMLDTELEMGLEFTEEVIPFAMEYFTGVKHGQDEIMDYMQEIMHNKDDESEDEEEEDEKPEKNPEPEAKPKGGNRKTRNKKKGKKR